MNVKEIIIRIPNQSHFYMEDKRYFFLIKGRMFQQTQTIPNDLNKPKTNKNISRSIHEEIFPSEINTK